jgi:hypothetical protein
MFPDGGRTDLSPFVQADDEPTRSVLGVPWPGILNLAT